MSDYIADTPPIPPLSSIADINTRKVLQALVDGWETRNGTTGDASKAFVRVADVTAAINTHGRGYGTTDGRRTKAAQELGRLMVMCGGDSITTNIVSSSSSVTKNSTTSTQQTAPRATVQEATPKTELFFNAVTPNSQYDLRDVTATGAITLNVGDKVLLMGAAVFVRSGTREEREFITAVDFEAKTVVKTKISVPVYVAGDTRVVDPDANSVGLALAYKVGASASTQLRYQSTGLAWQPYVHQTVDYAFTATVAGTYIFQLQSYAAGWYSRGGITPQLIAIVFRGEGA